MTGRRGHRRPVAELVALLLTFTICAVLVVVVADLMLAAKLSTTDRAASLAALGAIGLALAVGIGRWLSGSTTAARDAHWRRLYDPDDDDEDA